MASKVGRRSGALEDDEHECSTDGTEWRSEDASAGSFDDTTTVTNVITVMSATPNRRQRRDTNGATATNAADIEAMNDASIVVAASQTGSSGDLVHDHLRRITVHEHLRQCHEDRRDQRRQEDVPEQPVPPRDQGNQVQPSTTSTATISTVPLSTRSTVGLRNPSSPIRSSSKPTTESCAHLVEHDEHERGEKEREQVKDVLGRSGVPTRPLLPRTLAGDVGVGGPSCLVLDR